MQIVLKVDVDKLGSLGDEVDVKRGFARNYLIPKGYAVPLTRANSRQIEHQRGLLAEKRKAAVDKAKDLAEKLEDLVLEFKMKAGGQGKLFGSVTQHQIVEALAEKGITLGKKVFHLSAPIKTLGPHTFTLKLHTEVSANLQLKVVAEQAENEEAAEASEGSVDEKAEVEVAETKAEK